MTRYRWFRAGDFNAFFALVFDNVANLVILTTILVGAFNFPRDLVLYRIVPGTAIGVLIGDLIYAWMAIRLAKRAIYRNAESDLRSALEFETFAQNACFETEDAREGIRAFVDKRAPVFRGR